MYSVDEYAAMISDRGRMAPYLEALRQVVQPDSVVVDVGAGTGIFALLACQLGARRVFAIEPNNAIHVAKELARTNGYENRIDFIQDLSTKVTLPEQADIIVSDLSGIVPLLHGHIPAIIDARERFLAPNGILIPQSDTLWAAISEEPETFVRRVPSRNGNDYGLDLSAMVPIVTNSFHPSFTNHEKLLSEPMCWCTLDYTRIQETAVRGRVDLAPDQAAVGGGVLVWFDRLLFGQASFSNAPSKPRMIYGRLFFPWPEPVSLVAGDTVSVDFHATVIDDDYLWRWNTRVFDRGDPLRVKADFKQSTFFGTPLSPRHRAKSGEDYRPMLDADGEIDRFILEKMDGSTSIRDVADQLEKQFPSTFITRQSSLARVTKLSRRYSLDRPLDRTQRGQSDS